MPRGTLYEINNLEIWLLVIGCLIGAMALIAALTTCCLFTRFVIQHFLNVVPYGGNLISFII